MNLAEGLRSPTRSLRVFLAVFVAFGTLSVGLTFAAADELLKTKHLVERARLTWQSFIADPNMQPLIDLAKKAKGVLIAPQVLKGAFIFGASGGSGVLLTREQLDGPWSGPAFYTLGSVNFGLQAGGQAAEVALLAMTDRGVTAFLASSFKLGGDIGLALGPVGAGASAATANLSADILSFSRAKGLYGGISVDGAVVAVRKGFNNAYYGKEVRVTDILVRKAVKNPHAGLLIGSVAQEAGGR